MSRSAEKARDEEIIFCHDNSINRLSSFIQSGNIPHAFLFSGTKGIGKSAVADKFAKMILSIGHKEVRTTAEPEEIDLFGGISAPIPSKIPASLINKNISDKISRGNHLDILTLKLDGSDKKNISVDEVRDVAKFLSLTPSDGIYRVVMIDSIDDFTPQASNAILKILEEPTKNTVIIILCHSKINLLPTIKSRCFEIKFSPLTKKDFIITMSDLGYEDGLDNIYEVSSGSPGIALGLLKNSMGELFERYRAVISKNPVNISEVIAIAKEIKEKNSWGDFSNLLLSHYKKALSSGKGITEKSLHKYDKMSDIVSSTERANMDIQDGLKYITSYIKS